MSNVHYSVAKRLLNDNDYVVVPVLNVSRLVQKKNRKVSPRTVRMLTTWSHALFRDRLESAAYRRPGKYVIFPGDGYTVCEGDQNDIGEPSTTITCPRCGVRNRSMKIYSSIFRCVAEACRYEIDRQWNGAINNALAVYTRARRVLRLLLEHGPDP
jgi:transposase